MKALLVVLVGSALVAPTVVAAPPRAPAVVPVVVAHATGPPDRATGFVAGDERVVTVAHVLGGAVTVAGRRATVVRTDPRLDLAVLRVPGLRGPRPRVARGGDPLVITAGGPRPAPLVRRIVARLDGVERPALELRAVVAAGDSGAPVVTRGGRLAGVVFARSRTRAATAYALDCSAAPACRALGR
jgi:S1-C subfamily serine protease